MARSIGYESEDEEFDDEEAEVRIPLKTQRVNYDAGRIVRQKQPSRFSSSSAAGSPRIVQSQQRQRQNRRKSQGVPVAATGFSLFFTFVKSNSIAALLMLSVLFNVLFLFEKTLMDDTTNSGDNQISKPKNQGQHSYDEESSSSNFPDSQYPICHKLPHGQPQQIWGEFLGAIFEASRLPSDYEDELHDLRAQMLAMVSPQLPLGVKTLDKDWKTVARVINKAYQRWEYINDPIIRNTAEFEPPKVVVMVFGGSVPFGVGCNTGIKFHELKTCSWPFRLQIMLKNLLGGDVIQIKNLAVGGTNSAVGSTILKYDVLAEETSQADIIINAYATNDNIEEEEDIFDMIQQFCRQALSPHPCKQEQQQEKPLLIYLNDALGDDRQPVRESTDLPGVIEVLSSYYGFGSISYVDIVKQWVYGDSKETWFSPDTHNWDGTGSDKKSSGSIQHPGQGMHITTSWIISYYMISLVTNFCALEPWNVLGPAYSMMEIPYLPQKLPPGLPLELKNSSDPTLIGKPKSPPQDLLPPALNQTMTMHDVSNLWQTSKLSKMKCNHQTQTIGGIWKQCPFSWVSDHGAIGNTWLKANILDKTVDHSDWIMEPPHITKPGFRTPDNAKAGRSHMTIEFQSGDLAHKISRVVIFTNKGHTSQWINSTANIEITIPSSSSSSRVDGDDIEWEVLGSRVVEGYQNRSSSKMEVHDIPLSKEMKASSTKLRVRLTLESGRIFKLLGLALCGT